MLSQDKCNLRLLDRTLETLSGASPRLKKQILKASVQCIGSDRTITAHEAELIRAVVDSLDCPIPRSIPVPLRTRLSNRISAIFGTNCHLTTRGKIVNNSLFFLVDTHGLTPVVFSVILDKT